MDILFSDWGRLADDYACQPRDEAMCFQVMHTYKRFAVLPSQLLSFSKAHPQADLETGTLSGSKGSYVLEAESRLGKRSCDCGVDVRLVRFHRQRRNNSSKLFMNLVLR
jgi:hypothetical protein